MVIKIWRLKMCMFGVRTENKELPWRRLYHHCWHHRLSLWFSVLIACHKSVVSKTRQICLLVLNNVTCTLVKSTFGSVTYETITAAFLIFKISSDSTRFSLSFWWRINNACLSQAFLSGPKWCWYHSQHCRCQQCQEFFKTVEIWTIWNSDSFLWTILCSVLLMTNQHLIQLEQAATNYLLHREVWFKFHESLLPMWQLILGRCWFR